jgi:cell division protein FtsB
MSDINRSRMIPLHVADQAVAACEVEIEKLKAENARLKAEVERLTDSITRGASTPDAQPHA